MDYRYLGPLEILGSSGEKVPLGSPKQRMLLALLLLSPNRVVSTDRIVDALWREDPPRSATHSIHIYVSRLRKALAAAGAPGVLETVPPGYRLHVGDTDIVDGDAFAREVGAGHDLLDRGDVSGGSKQLELGLAHWRNDPFADIGYEEFLQAEIRRLRELRRGAVERLCAVKVAAGSSRDAIPVLQALSEDVPFSEPVARLLARALYGEDRHAEALKCLHRFRARIGEELGIEPSAELVELEEQMLLHDPRLVEDRPRRPIGALSANPYKGLHPFMESDAGDFFGRDRVVEALLQRLGAGASVLSVVGPSGCGKTSIVMAGLLAQLRKGALPGSESWPTAVMTPGDDPFASLAGALHGKGPRTFASAAAQGVLVVIDQFEELFALNHGDVQAEFLQKLMAGLAEPEGRLRLITAMRADFFDRPLTRPDFGRVYTDGVFHVFPLAAEDLEAAIVEPARRQGVAVEPALLAALIADASRNPGALPLFEYALTELFEQRSGQQLTLEDYDALGRLELALGRRAEALYAGLGESGKATARQLFLRLVTVTEQVVTRRRTMIAELLAAGTDPVEMQSVLDAFTRHRLLVLDRDPATRMGTVEVAHEALLTEWPRMRAWLVTHRRHLRRYQALQADAREWIQAARHPDYLLSGSRLRTYLEWAAAAPIALTLAEREYLRAGEEAAREEEAAAEEQVATTRRYRRRSLIAAGLLFLLVAVAGSATGLMFLTRDSPVRVGALFGAEAGDDGVVQLVDAAIGRAETEHGIEPVTLAAGASTADWGLQTASVTLGEGLMILPGGGPEEAVATVAPQFPGITYVLIDGALIGPNVISVGFAEEQGGYLVGLAAALKTETGRVGFIGGQPVGFVDRARAGFEAGVAAADSTVEVVADYLYDPEREIVPHALDQWSWYYAFNWPEGARLAAAAMFRSGVDIVFVVAGGSSSGVFEAAYDEQVPGETKLWVIGHSDDDYLTVPDRWKPHVLTSSVKRTEVVIGELIGAYDAGRLEGGTRLRFDASDDAIGFSTSGGFVDDIVPTLEAYRERLAAGQIVAPSWLPGRGLG